MLVRVSGQALSWRRDLRAERVHWAMVGARFGYAFGGARACS